MRDHLIALYDQAGGQSAFERLCRLLDDYRPRLRRVASQKEHALAGLSERDAVLITYGDQVSEPGVPPLRTLAGLGARYLWGIISTIHILPFYPYSSDDGFAVIDYRAVNPSLGTWQDVECLGSEFRLMFDAVLNHISQESAWFRTFLQGDPAYRDYFIAIPEGTDLSGVVRPRTLPLLTRFASATGEQQVWTTFSADQIDLNYHQPQVLLDAIETVLFYVEHGADLIRLDAIAYLWKEIGTTCIHRPQTHRIIQLLRAVLDDVAPHVLLVTETNVPHADNVSYFGDGMNEAQLVYNFALPPLVLHTLHTGCAAALARWAAGLALPSERVAFFNFLASHDGIGLSPVQGILSATEIDALVARALAHGGRVSYRHNGDGTESPYELNINYFDALSGPGAAEPPATQIDRFLAAQAIMLSLAGVPGIYFHSLFGSRGWPEGVARTGQNRTVNRQKCDRAELERELADPASLRHQVYSRYARLLGARAASAAFHPAAPQQVLALGEAVFAVLRSAESGGERVLCLHNVTARFQAVEVDLAALGLGAAPVDLLTGSAVSGPRAALRLAPYQVLWLRSGPAQRQPA